MSSCTFHAKRSVFGVLPSVPLGYFYQGIDMFSIFIHHSGCFALPFLGVHINARKYMISRLCCDAKLQARKHAHNSLKQTCTHMHTLKHKLELTQHKHTCVHTPKNTHLYTNAHMQAEDLIGRFPILPFCLGLRSILPQVCTFWTSS